MAKSGTNPILSYQDSPLFALLHDFKKSMNDLIANALKKYNKKQNPQTVALLTLINKYVNLYVDKVDSLIKYFDKKNMPYKATLLTLVKPKFEALEEYEKDFVSDLCKLLKIDADALEELFENIEEIPSSAQYGYMDSIAVLVMIAKPSGATLQHISQLTHFTAAQLNTKIKEFSDISHPCYPYSQLGDVLAKGLSDQEREVVLIELSQIALTAGRELLLALTNLPKRWCELAPFFHDDALSFVEKMSHPSALIKPISSVAGVSMAYLFATKQKDVLGSEVCAAILNTLHEQDQLLKLVQALVDLESHYGKVIVFSNPTECLKKSNDLFKSISAQEAKASTAESHLSELIRKYTTLDEEKGQADKTTKSNVLLFKKLNEVIKDLISLMNSNRIFNNAKIVFDVIKSILLPYVLAEEILPHQKFTFTNLHDALQEREILLAKATTEKLPSVIESCEIKLSAHSHAVYEYKHKLIACFIKLQKSIYQYQQGSSAISEEFKQAEIAFEYKLPEVNKSNYLQVVPQQYVDFKNEFNKLETELKSDGVNLKECLQKANELEARIIQFSDNARTLLESLQPKPLLLGNNWHSRSLLLNNDFGHFHSVFRLIAIALELEPHKDFFETLSSRGLSALEQERELLLTKYVTPSIYQAYLHSNQDIERFIHDRREALWKLIVSIQAALVDRRNNPIKEVEESKEEVIVSEDTFEVDGLVIHPPLEIDILEEVVTPIIHHAPEQEEKPQQASNEDEYWADVPGSAPPMHDEPGPLTELIKYSTITIPNPEEPDMPGESKLPTHPVVPEPTNHGYFSDLDNQRAQYHTLLPTSGSVVPQENRGYGMPTAEYFSDHLPLISDITLNSKQLKLITWNLTNKNGTPFEESKIENSNREARISSAIKKMLTKLKPDCILLQENFLDADDLSNMLAIHGYNIVINANGQAVIYQSSRLKLNKIHYNVGGRASISDKFINSTQTIHFSIEGTNTKFYLNNVNFPQCEFPKEVDSHITKLMRGQGTDVIIGGDFKAPFVPLLAFDDTDLVTSIVPTGAKDNPEIPGCNFTDGFFYHEVLACREPKVDVLDPNTCEIRGRKPRYEMTQYSAEQQRELKRQRPMLSCAREYANSIPAELKNFDVAHSANALNEKMFVFRCKDPILKDHVLKVLQYSANKMGETQSVSGTVVDIFNDKNKLRDAILSYQPKANPTTVNEQRALLISKLIAYIDRIESHKTNFEGQTNGPNFRYGFWVLKQSRSLNREVNYTLAKDILKKMLDTSESIGDIFNSIATMKSDLIKNKYSNRADFCDRGIRSNEFAAVIALGKDLGKSASHSAPRIR